MAEETSEVTGPFVKPPIGKWSGPAGKWLARIKLPDQVVQSVAVDVGRDPVTIAVILAGRRQNREGDRSGRIATGQQELADE